MENQLDIRTLKGGALVEMANVELAKMVNDVADINKKADSKRELTIKLSLLPNEDGQVGKAVIAVTSTLGKQKEQATTVYFGHDGRTGIASEQNIASLPDFHAANSQ